jgi:hypothetical protein
MGLYLTPKHEGYSDKTPTTTKTSPQHNKQKPPFPWVRKGGSKQQNIAVNSIIINKIINNIRNTIKTK